MGKMEAQAAAATPGLMLTVQADGLKWPEMPVFASKEDERTHRKQRLAASFRIFAMHGFDSGIGGHITVRDPILTDHFWVNPLGVHFSRIKASDLVLVDHAGNVKQGRHPINAAAYAIHSSIHRARPDVIGAAHAHARFGSTWSSLAKLIPPITQEATSFYKDHGLYDGYGGVAGEVSEGEMIGRALGDKKAVICRNHGLFTVGHSVEEAVFWFIRMERACEQALMAYSTGLRPVEIDDATATLASRQVGSHRSGWYSLQPLMDKVLAEQPDVVG